VIARLRQRPPFSSFPVRRVDVPSALLEASSVAHIGDAKSVLTLGSLTVAAAGFHRQRRTLYQRRQRIACNSEVG